MKKVIVKKIDKRGVEAAEVAAVLDQAGVEFNSVETVNWPEVAPYKPDVKFRIAHTGGEILLQYVVSENHVRAAAAGDDGPVWEDSCVEFFMSLPSGNYYNVECNCAGTMLCGVGLNRNDRERASLKLLEGVKRYTTIDEKCFDSKEAPGEWSLSMVIPSELYYKDEIKDFSGLKTTANFYKCGDLLPEPHFLSYFPIGVENPNFHLPEYFGEIEFEA